MGEYDYKQYWKNRPQNLKINKEFKLLLEAHIGESDPVLDGGCGVGTYLQLFPYARGIDISPRRLKVVPSICNNVVIKADLIDIPYLDKNFEVSYTVEVMQHLPPEILVKAQEELMRVTRYRIIHLEYFEAVPSRPLEPHCFNHNLLTHYLLNGWEAKTIHRTKSSPKTVLYVLDRENVYCLEDHKNGTV